MSEDSKQLVKLTRLTVKVPAGDTGARAGLVLVTNEDPTGEELTKKLELFDSWTLEDYNSFLNERLDFVDVQELMWKIYFDVE